MSSQLQNKLLHYEVPPPEGVWDKVVASLDKNASLTLSEKLYNYREEPSPAAWEKISTRLDQPLDKKAKVIPFYIQYRKPLKYSGAVAVFIFLAVITSLFISKKTESELPLERVVNSHTSAKKDTSKTQIDSKENNSLSLGVERSRSMPATAKANKIRMRSEGKDNSFSLAESLLPRQAQRNHVISSSFDSDKYMIYSDGDGNVVRLPKKLFNAFACPTGDISCKQRLQELREKFAESAVTADFNGLLQILKSLQENQ